MAVYQISYDLRRPGKDYNKLYAALGKLGASRILLSDWIVTLNKVTAAHIRDALLPYIDKTDRLVVFAVSDWATYNAVPAGQAHLKRDQP